MAERSATAAAWPRRSAPTCATRRRSPELVGDVEKRLGPIDILVFNATGPQPMLQLEDLTWRDCLDQLEFFVKSPLLLAKAVVPGMKQRRYGRIIQIGSEVFEKGVPRVLQLRLGQGAQLGLTRSWAMELAPWGITVNAVSPGWIPTERHAGTRRRPRTPTPPPCRCGAWAGRRTWPRPWRTWRPTPRGSSPDRSYPSTAGIRWSSV